MVITAKETIVKTSILHKSFRYQALASFIVQIIVFSHGIGIGWLSPTLKLLQSSNTPLQGIITVTETSWIGGLYGLGSVFGNIVFGIIIDKMGRKWSLYLVAIPHMSLWIFIYFAQDVTFLYISRFLGGATAGGILIVVPIFIAEIADPIIRGALSSLTIFFICLGILVGFILSSQLDYYLTPWIVVVLPILYMFALIMLPEPPQSLLRKGKIAEAERSYLFYKNAKSHMEIRPTTQNACTGFNELKTAILCGNQGTKISLSDFFNKPALKAFLTALIIMGAVQLSFSFAFINYMSDIFAATGSNMDSDTCTIVVGVIQIIGTCISIASVDSFGRKKLMLTSAGSVGLCTLTFGVFMQFIPKHFILDYNWLPLLFMGCIILSSSIGMSGLVFVLIVEIIPNKIRSVGTSTCMTIFSVFVFVALKLCPLMLQSFGLPFTMYTSAAVCLTGFIYLLLFLKETKGKSMDFEKN